MLKVKTGLLRWTHAQLRPVLLGGQGARRRRRPVDPADRPRASPSGPVPVHRPEERPAGHRHQPALRPAPRTGARPGWYGGRRPRHPSPPRSSSLTDAGRNSSRYSSPRRPGESGTWPSRTMSRRLPQPLVRLPRLALPARPRPRRSAGRRSSCAATDRPAVIEVSDGSVHTRLGTTPAPDLILQGTPRLILGVLSARLTLDEAAGLGLEISGDTAVLKRVQPEPAAGPS